jgi:rod shape determining protein RodA
MQIDRRILRSLDLPLLLTAISIPTLGLIVLYSAAYDPDGTDLVLGFIPRFVPSPAFIKQIIFICVGLFLALIVSMLSTSKLAKAAYFFYGVCITLLIAVDLFGVVIKGSQRWIDFGPIHFQPSEITKMGVILAMAKYLASNPSPRGGFKFTSLILPCLIFMIPMGFILKQPDLGTALTIGLIGATMTVFAGVNFRTAIIAIIIGLSSLYPAWHQLHDYQKRRVMVLVDPESDPLGSGYHITQSKIAVGSGELFGKGFLQGTQTQLQFLPEHSTDFIFSVLAEEWGLVGCMIVLSLYLFLLYRLCRVITKARDSFSMFLVVGLTAYIFSHVAINIGMVIGLLPVVGIPLPLFSYGGSSLLSNMLAIGLAVGVSLRRTMRIDR